MGQKPRALIVEHGLARGALAGARGLDAAGWHVDVGSPVAGLTARSRAIGEWRRLPALEAGGEEFVESVAGAVRNGGYEIVFSAGDAELLLLSEQRERIGAIVPHPPHPALLRGLDKLDLMRTAREAGLEVPRTWEPDDWPEAGFGRAVIVKPRLRLASADEPGRRLGTRIAATDDEVSRLSAEIEAAGSAPLVQERLSGVLMAWSCVLDDHGRVLAEVQQEARRVWPPGGGVSARAVTVPVSPEISSGARALLERLSWEGLVQLQFIRAADGRARLIDLNPRFYGSMALAIGAGANLPAIWAAVATGRTPIAGLARAGERYQWLTGDVRALFAEYSRGAPAELGRTLRWALGAHHSVWSPRDPAPSAWYLAHLGRLWAIRRKGNSPTEDET